MKQKKFTSYFSSLRQYLFTWITSNPITILALLVTFVFSLAGSLVSLHRYWQFEVFYYDFGIFDQAIWRVAHFSPPIIDHLVVGGKWIFADHFNPSIFLYAPLYWITDRREIILIAQAVTVGLSGFVLYDIGTRVLKHKFYAFAIQLCYFLFVGLQNAVITDFHEVTVATLAFMLTYWSLFTKRYKLFFLFLLITLGFKESNFLLGLGIGVSILVLDKKLFKIALLTGIISLLWGFMSITYVIPYFSGGIYQYGVAISYNPITIIKTFIDNPIKIHTMVFSLLSFGFLPLLSPAFWFLVFQDFLTRFYSPLSFTRWDLGLHYNALLACIMGLSSLFSIKMLQRYIPEKVVQGIVLILLIMAIVLYRFTLRGPFALAYNPAFYAHTKDFQFLHTLIEKIPKHATVMAQNNLSVWFDHQQVWMLQSNKKRFYPADYYSQKMPDYIVFDLRDGQNPNDFFPMGTSDIPYLLDTLQHDPSYTIFYQSSQQYIFKKIH